MNTQSEQDNPLGDAAAKGYLAYKQEQERKALRAKGPYYRESQAERFKAILIKLHSTKRPQRILANDVTANTCRLQYYQGTKYLTDHDAQYKDMVDSTRCITHSDYIELHIKRKARYSSYDAVPWKDDLDLYLSTAANNGDKFERNDICLSTEEQAQIAAMLAPLEGQFIADIGQNHLKIIRYVE